MNKQARSDDNQIWHELIESYEAVLSEEHRLYSVRQKFLRAKIDRVSNIRQALVGRVPKVERMTALYITPLLEVTELMQLFEELVFIASYTHGYAHIVREQILKLPREWVLERIEQVAEPHLLEGDDNEYQRLLELYIELDDDLTRRLALRAAAHSDPHIKEAGEDFLEYLAESE